MSMEDKAAMELENGMLPAQEALASVNLQITTDGLVEAGIEPYRVQLEARKKDVRKRLSETREARVRLIADACRGIRETVLKEYDYFAQQGYGVADRDGVTVEHRVYRELRQGVPVERNSAQVSGAACMSKSGAAGRISIKVSTEPRDFTEEQEKALSSMQDEIKALEKLSSELLREQQEGLPDMQRKARVNLVNATLNSTDSGRKVLNAMSCMGLDGLPQPAM